MLMFVSYQMELKADVIIASTWLMHLAIIIFSDVTA